MDSLGLDTSSKLRLQFLLGMCIITGGIFFCLSILNLGLTSSYLLGSLQLMFAIFSAYFVYSLGQKKIKPGMQFCYLMSLSLLVLFAAHSTALSKAAYLWALIFPMMYYFLLGRKHAWLLCIGILLGQIGIIYLKIGILLSPPIVNFTLCFLLLWNMSHIYESARSRSEAALAELALKDPLTQANNRLALKKAFNEQLAAFEAGSTPSLYFMIIDVDHFKQVNDIYGHETGDGVLVEVAQRLFSLIGKDSVFRIGGEEFCVMHLCPSLESASELAESARQVINGKTFNIKDKEICLTISIGVCGFQGGMQLNQVLNVADEALYLAKSRGRNCVVTSPRTETV